MFFTLFLTYPLIGWAILVVGAICRLPLSATMKRVLGYFTLVCSLKFFCYAIFGGNSFDPELPVWITTIWSWAFSSVMLTSLLVALYWIVRYCVAGVVLIVTALTRRGDSLPKDAAGMPRPQECALPRSHNPLDTRRGFIFGAFAVTAAGVSAHGIHEGMRAPTVKEVVLEFSNLPAQFDGYRMVQLSDLHISSALRKPRTEAIVRMVNALNPDLICITGDLIDGETDKRLEDVEPLGGLRAKDGVLGCTGNHEYYSGYGMWRPVFTNLGIEMLENRATSIKRDGAELAVVGINDPTCGDWGRVDVALNESAPDAFKILLMHRPIILRQCRTAGVSLQLSGHTHGGGVSLLAPIVARANQGHVRGIYREDGITLYVNQGTGQWAGFPMRLGNPSEITNIVLRRSAS